MMKKIKTFFKKIWEFIKKIYKVVANFIKENVWAQVLAILAAVVLFILVFQGVVKLIDKATSKEEETVNMATALTATELRNKIDNKESFVLFIGGHSCAHCRQFYTTINAYISEGKTVYYFDVEDTSDVANTTSFRLNVLRNPLVNNINIKINRGIKELATPTTVVVQDGKFVDAIQGAIGMDGGQAYVDFTRLLAGEFINKKLPSTLPKANS